MEKQTSPGIGATCFLENQFVQWHPNWLSRLGGRVCTPASREGWWIATVPCPECSQRICPALNQTIWTLQKQKTGFHSKHMKRPRSSIWSATLASKQSISMQVEQKTEFVRSWHQNKHLIMTSKHIFVVMIKWHWSWQTFVTIMFVTVKITGPSYSHARKRQAWSQRNKANHLCNIFRISTTRAFPISGVSGANA